MHVNPTHDHHFICKMHVGSPTLKLLDHTCICKTSYIYTGAGCACAYMHEDICICIGICMSTTPYPWQYMYVYMLVAYVQALGKHMYYIYVHIHHIHIHSTCTNSMYIHVHAYVHCTYVLYDQLVCSISVFHLQPHLGSAYIYVYMERTCYICICMRCSIVNLSVNNIVSWCM